MIPPIDYTKLVLAATSYACNGAIGRSHLGDHVFGSIVEGRQEQTERMRKYQRSIGVAEKDLSFYSACADLCHWLYWAIGVEQPWVNRDESRAVDGTGWQVEKNIRLLVSASMCAEPCDARDRYKPGDVLHIGTPGKNDDHVMVVRGHVGDVVTVAEYGQPGGKIQDHALTWKASKVSGLGPVGYTGYRRMLHVLRLDRVLASADSDGKLVAPSSAFMALLEPWIENT